jgi:GH15 family glucan-1,4-alpha-glucosidase
MATEAILERILQPEQQEQRKERHERASRVIPYPPIQEHGIIGDRRTAALVAADGTMDWLCLPDFDGVVVFGGMLDALKGGHWRLGPARMVIGRQTYLEETVVLETRWEFDEGTLVLQDAMLWPQDQRPPEQAGVRVIVRRLRCEKGVVEGEMELHPGENFRPDTVSFAEYSSGFTLQLQELSLRFWTTHQPEVLGSRLQHSFQLKAGEELWAVLELGAAGHSWSIEAARNALEEVKKYWAGWSKGVRSFGTADKEMRRTAALVHLLTYAPEGSVVAAPTTSLPERIGGGWNADYRLCWVRDASLSVGMLARLGVLQETELYLQWLMRRLARFGQPLQVLYGIRGEKKPRQEKVEASGYRDSQPVRFGNHAYKQHQLGSLGYLADCVWIHLSEGGKWRDEYWDLIRRLANYTAKHWQRPENGIWELSDRRHYVSSKVMSWVMLDRAIKIAQKVEQDFETSAWKSTCDAIHSEVMDKGWSETLGSFRQHYDGENLDASTLLVSVMEFLPGDHPRVLGTIDRVAEFLTIDHAVFRFNPLETAGAGEFPLGQFEGAFWPCTFWLATACAKAGRMKEAKAVLEKAEKLAGPLGLFSEAVDPRNGSFCGNMPLLFSHAEYVRAKLEIGRQRG